MFTHFFIKRPIFSTVIALLFFCLGAVTYVSLPIEQFPNVIPPTVVVSTQWPGASAEDVVDSVAIPIESQVNGVDKMIYMESKSTSNGYYQLTVTFDIGTDPDIATTLVQNRVSRATASLPAAVSQIGVTTTKKSSNIIMVVNLFDRIAGAANRKRVAKLQEKADEKLAAELRAFGHVHAEHGESLIARFADFLRGEKAETVEKSDLDDWEYDEQGRIVNVKTKEVHVPLDSLYLANYAKASLQDDLARVRDVGDVTLYDSHDFSMRIWLDNDLMALRGLSANQVVQRIEEQNQMVSAGRVGARPAPAGQQTNIVLTTLGRLTEVEDFKNIVLTTDAQGRTLHLGDIAKVERGSESYLTESELNGLRATSLGISQLPGSNGLEIADRLVEKLESMKADFKSHGLDYAISYNSTEFVRISIEEVLHTLIEAVFIVVFVVYVFLQNWRAAIIPTLTVPVSLVGAFFLMNLFGFTLNTLTLFGLVLVIGIVVDDSILVVENTQRILDAEPDLSPYQATKRSMIEMAGPVIGTTIVLMTVFVPTAMIAGMVGQLYKQFALTIAGAIGISGVCALTFAPALSCVLLRSEKRAGCEAENPGSAVARPRPASLVSWVADIALTTIFAHLVLHMFGFAPPLILLAAVAAALFCPLFTRNKRPFFFNLFNIAFDALNAAYIFLMTHLAKAALLVLLLWGGMVYGLGWAFSVMPTGFLPEEDQGVMFVDVTLPEGASDERAEEVMQRVRGIIDENRAGIENTIMITGNSMLQGMNQVNCGMGFIKLQHWKERTGPGLDAKSIQRRLMVALADIPDAEAFVFSPPPIYGIGTSGGLELRLLDRAQFGSVALAEAGETAIDAGMSSGNILFGQSQFDPTAPRYFLNIDREKCYKLFLSLDDVFGTLGTMIGSTYVNDFNEFNQVYRVTVQAEGKNRADIESVLDLQVRNANGDMVEFRSFAAVENEMGPEVITRFNMYQAEPITAVVNPAKSSGQAIAAMEAACATLPDGFTPSWTGMTYQEKAVGTQQYAIFAMSIVFAFLILSALYESWSSPVIIMMAVPLGVMGALLAVGLFGMPVNIYTQIGLIIMVGLSAKNAILITEVARELRVGHGMNLHEAAVTAGHRRMRPIMMTSYAFILGVIPLAVATGAGALGRNAIGRAVCGGMLNETMIGIFVTPALFILFQSYSEWFAKFLKTVIGETGNDGT